MQLTTKISTNTSLVGGAIALAKCARVSCACRSDHRHIGPHLPFAAADNCNINIKVNNYNNLVSYNLVKIQLHFTSSTAMNLAEISLPVNRLRHRERDTIKLRLAPTNCIHMKTMRTGVVCTAHVVEEVERIFSGRCSKT